LGLAILHQKSSTPTLERILIINN